ncbi:hypothetical protein [Lacimicrobium sp. SS2-24]|uniref:hypothetical protein n=1 Tax=Lacimicrobium sp. SS2-24 TaxID=2005569 RepID=UPI000B4A9B34|nr:hypothetical protein [Lacimicrobium sp. SS2-24]
MQIESYQARFELTQQQMSHTQRHVAGLSPGAPVSDMPPQSTLPSRVAVEPDPDASMDTDGDYRQALKKRLIELMSRRELDWYDPRSIKNTQSDSKQGIEQSTPESRMMVRETKLDYQAYQLQLELEVKNENGQSQAFSASLDWQQLNISSSLTIMSTQQLKDPLVLNFDWQPVRFKGDTAFDLDNDGNTDRLPTPQGHAGYLVRDINHNARIDDSNELIGVQSGDAWADIRAMDSNGDGWLNHQDNHYEDLYWWQPGSGKSLFSLTDLKVDGLLLQGAATQADIAPDGEKQARLRQTGAFVYNTRQLGLMQQFDFYI